jgi:hypothetical protein
MRWVRTSRLTWTASGNENQSFAEEFRPHCGAEHLVPDFIVRRIEWGVRFPLRGCRLKDGRVSDFDECFARGVGKVTTTIPCTR